MPEPWNALSFLFLGWLLGILGTTIQSLIGNYRLRRQIAAGFITELEELREGQAATVLTIETKTNGLTKELMRWYKSHHTFGRELPAPLNQLTALLDKLEAIDDATFAQLGAKFKAPKGGGMNIKQVEMPYVLSKLGCLELFDNEIQRRILEILSHVKIANQYVEEARMFFQLTFDASLSEKNHQSASDQVWSAYSAFAQNGRLLAGLCDIAIKKMQESRRTPLHICRDRITSLFSR